MNAFGDYLHRLRKERGITQQELAEKLGLSNKAISKWETGETFPETSQLIPLADLFDVSVDELLHGRDDLSKKPGEPVKIKRRPVYYFGQAAALCCAVTLLVFVFFIGCTSFTDARFSVPETNLFYYFGDVYDDINATKVALYDYYLENDSLVDGCLYTVAIFGTLCSAAILVLVALYSILTIVRIVNNLLHLSQKDPAKTLIPCFLCFVIGCGLLLSLQAARITNRIGELFEDHAYVTVQTMLNPAAISGLALSASFFAIYIVCRFLQREHAFRIEKTVSYAFSAVGIILLSVAFGYLVSPMLCMKGANSLALSPLTLMRFYGSYQFKPNHWGSISYESDSWLFGELADEPYDSTGFVLICILLYVPLIILIGLQLYRLSCNFCDGRRRTPIIEEILTLLIIIPFTLLTVIPISTLSEHLHYSAYYDGLVIACVLLCVQFAVGIAHVLILNRVKIHAMQKRISELEAQL